MWVDLEGRRGGLDPSFRWDDRREEEEMDSLPADARTKGRGNPPNGVVRASDKGEVISVGGRF